MILYSEWDSLHSFLGISFQLIIAPKSRSEHIERIMTRKASILIARRAYGRTRTYRKAITRHHSDQCSPHCVVQRRPHSPNIMMNFPERYQAADISFVAYDIGSMKIAGTYREKQSVIVFFLHDIGVCDLTAGLRWCH